MASRRYVVAALAIAATDAACMPNPFFALRPTSDTTSESTSGEPGSTSEPATTTTPLEPTTTTDAPDSTTDRPTTTTAALTTGLTTSDDTDPDTTSTSDPSSTSTTSSDTSSDTSGVQPGCGDQVQGGDEECDDGPANSDEGLCTSACKLAVCGDALVRVKGDDPEGCDHGALNGSGPGACSNDCAVVIPEKTYKIFLSSFGVPGTLHHPSSNVPNGIAAGDDACSLKVAPGSKILAVDNNKRIATTEPWTGKDRVDWVLKPYTGYTDGLGNPLGVTGHERLLGVQNGKMVALKQPISPGNEQPAWTGLLGNWLGANNNCSGWTTTSAVKNGKIGNSGLKDGWLDGAGDGNCSNDLRIYCVEQ